MNKNKTNQWLNSGEYSTDIAGIRTEIMKNCAVSNSEATTAAIFERELYHIIRVRTGLKLDFVKEKVINGIEHKFGQLSKRQSGTGRLDAIVNDIIIEYKHRSKLDTREHYDLATEQVKDYLIALNKEEHIKYNAILTDGLRICYFMFVGDEVSYSALSAISNKDIDMIIKAILAHYHKRFTPVNILKDFSISPHAPSISKTIALTFYDSLKNNATEKTHMLCEEWKSLMHLSVDDNGKGNDIEKRRKDLSFIFSDSITDTESEYSALYALQTTYAIIVKLIACKVVDKLQYNDNTQFFYDLTQISSSEMQKFFEKMEDGYSYRSNNITNFLEGDFFSWYSDGQQWNTDFWQNIKVIIQCIEEYSAFSMNVVYEPIDIFKDLYMSILPKSIRHSMGEYFTPKWLSDYVVTSSLGYVSNENWKAIDPCCGSGIFLISIIKKIVGKQNIQALSNEDKILLQRDILSRVYGIDINPLSVLSARVGYYLALLPFDNLHDVDIPVFLGDSAIIPEKIVLDDVPCYKYSVTNMKCPFDVILPVRFVKQSSFITIMSELQSCVKTDNADILFSVMVGGLSKVESQSQLLLDSIKMLAEKLVVLHKNHWDGIWIRITTNFMLIARLSEFDLIIGNPPWVKWEHLPTAYASKIKELCDIRHIFSGAGQYGGTQLNICALIANVTASNWLTKTGILAFLMPDSIMSQNSYEGFRNFYTDYEKGTRLYLQKIDKWEKPLRPFRCDNKPITQDFNTYYYSSNKVDYSAGIPVKKISRKRNVNDETLNNANSYDEAKRHLIFTDGKALQLSKKSSALSYCSDKYDFSQIIGTTDYLYRTGVEFTPQEIYMLKGIGASNKPEYYKFGNKTFSRSKYKVEDIPNGGWDFPVKNIYPIITGPHLSPFRYDTCDEYCILPYSEDNTQTPIIPEELLADSKELYLYLANHKNLIDKQSEKSKQMHRGDEFYSLSKIGSYTFANNIVAARDNTEFCASVIKKTLTPWGEEKQTICVKHTIIISQDKDKNFIGEDESYYICGILNSDVVRTYIMSSFKSNGYSLNKSNLYIPKYDVSNDIQLSIAKKAKYLSQNDDIEIIKGMKELSDLYLDLCKTKKNK